MRALRIGFVLCWLSLHLSHAAPGGQVFFSNVGIDVDAPVTDARTGDFVAADGSFLVQLYAGPDALSLQPVAGTTNFVIPGYFVGPTLTVSNVPGGTQGSFQLVVWEAAAGDSYEDAVANQGMTGASTVFDLFLPDPSEVPPPLPSSLTGLMSFVVSPGVGPMILSQPQPQTVVVGGLASFDVSATGAGLLTYQWRLNGLNVPNATNSMLNIPNAQSANSGVYSVRVSDQVGTVFSLGAPLTVLSFVQAQIESAPDGGTVMLPGGMFIENIVIDKDLILVGSPATILDGGGVGDVVRVESGVQVTLRQLTIRDGGRAGVFNLGSLHLEDVVLFDNMGTSARGGGLWNMGSAVLQGVHVEGNGNPASSFGGGLYNGPTGVLVVSNSWILDNHGASGGLHNEGQASIINSTFSDNLGVFGAGALGNYQGALTVHNSTLSGNTTSSEGGALYNFATATFQFCTIANNQAGLNAGGIWARLGNVSLGNTILSGNNLTGGGAANYLGSFVSLGHNLLDDTDGVTGVLQPSDLVGANPMLGLLADNGGPTRTHALLPGSAALDAGNCGTFSTDQRGSSRTLNAGLACDIGAFEVQEVTLTERGFVLENTLGILRNNFNGQVGKRFLVGNDAVTVTALGRMFFAGNSGVQTVRILRATDRAEIASVGVTMNGGTPGEFQYGHLAAPVVLAANTAYYLVSAEIAGGNFWADYVGTLLTVADIATVQAAVYFGSGFGWTEVLGASRSYVPCDFLFLAAPASPTATIAISAAPAGGGAVSGGGTVPLNSAVTVQALPNPGFGFASWTENGGVVSTAASYMFPAVGDRVLVANFTNNIPGGGSERAFVLQRTLGSPRNNFNGQVGKKILVGNAPVTVSGLGRMFFSGNTGTQTLRILRAADRVEVASLQVSMTGGTPGQFQYERFATPVVLAANTAYYVVSLEVVGGNTWADYVGTVLTVANIATVQGAVYSSTGLNWTEVLGGSWSYVPCDILYLDPAAGPSINIAVSSNPAAGGTVSGGGAYPSGAPVTVSATANPGFAFANWTESGAVISAAASYMFTSTSNRILTANFTNSTPGAQKGFVLQTTLGALRNNFSGQVGAKILIGAQPATVTALGRMFFSGNTGVHTVRIVRVGDLVEVASIPVNMAGGIPGQFRYANLSVPVDLAPHTAYYIVSAETQGGDSWADYVGTLLTVANIATVQGAVYFGGGFSWTEVTGAPWSYVPCDFLYLDATAGPTINVTVAANPPAGGSVSGGGTYPSGGSVSTVATPNSGFVFANWTEGGTVVSTTATYTFNTSSNRALVANFTNLVAGTEQEFVIATTFGNLKSDGASVGFQFTVGTNRILITALARMCAPGNSRTHELKLVQANGTQVPGGSAVVNMAGSTPGQFVWVSLPSAVTLQANTAYQIVSSEAWFLDAYYDWTTTVTTTAAAVCDGAGYLWYGWNFQGGQNTARGPLNFRYREEGVALPAGAGGGMTAQLAVHRDDEGRIVLRISGVAGQEIAIESTTDFQEWSSFDTVILSDDELVIEAPADQSRLFWRLVLPGR